ncbi:hypothetical protein SAMN05216489_08540 [Streptomyces sp. 3213]|nr:hypothetical protein [Streptomyces sp. 3213.3]SEE83717.1 hypothetical protein SAMN05216489_08540 [Streptomyces sp. 3213] [Streptomyces sp. 3213.3]
MTAVRRHRLWTEADNGQWGWMKDTAISSEINALPAADDTRGER